MKKKRASERIKQCGNQGKPEKKRKENQGIYFNIRQFFLM